MLVEIPGDIIQAAQEYNDKMPIVARVSVHEQILRVLEEWRQKVKK